MADIIPIGGGSDPPRRFDGDAAHGQAALLLSESILHALVDARLVSTEGALAIVHAAIEVNEKKTGHASGAADDGARSLHLLGRIATSLEADLH